MEDNILLEVKDLKTNFYNKGEKIEAVRGISFKIKDGEILGIVGESGSGKSVAMKSILGIVPKNAKIESGEIFFEGKDILKLSGKEKQRIKGNDISMIFQDPMTALNPLITIGKHLEEVILRYNKITKEEARKKAVDILNLVGIPMAEKRLNQYPHEFSGGMRQRVLIAMALSSEPKLLIADEPTTALDVTIQSQILNLLKGLKEKKNMSIVLITHDLGVVASLCSRIIVMYAGMIMEEGLTEDIFYKPAHPYTKALLNSIPKVDEDEKRRLEPIKGTAPSLLAPPKGCPFAERCSFAADKCFGEIPEYKSISETQKARCFLLEEGGKL
ncbi:MULTISPECIES: ABC transporter ATP-binding protein [Clostridium]|uniref:ABC transporter ATP-binding protein n=1 Tax=Clostridium TaxID=1485 RepID=UPI00069DB8E0|nr:MULTISPECIES: ABC transporter ATP-binding protein [Clostridium]KOF56983.1 peptide ABC transporter ATP-binding protein [Clostridium sp. DMHC 10]MCD2348903.1 ABC transporter ATP-binding protein [Clostridium guangxiense]